MKRWTLFFSLAFAALLTLGCATLDEKQRTWIFQPSDRAWGSSAELARDMDAVWIDFSSSVTAAPARLHGLWLAAKYPQRDRYIFDHSLGGAIAIDLAAQVADQRGTIVEGTFSSMSDLADTMHYGWLQGSWLPGALITQRFDSLRKVANIKGLLLVVHGENDNLIASALGRKLYDAAPDRKKFLLIDGASHFSATSAGQAQLPGSAGSAVQYPLTLDSSLTKKTTLFKALSYKPALGRHVKEEPDIRRQEKSP